MKCEEHVKAVLYEVAIYLNENRHDYEARELHAKVSACMNDEEFREGRRLAHKRYSVVNSLKTEPRG